MCSFPVNYFMGKLHLGREYIPGLVKRTMNSDVLILRVMFSFMQFQVSLSFIYQSGSHINFLFIEIGVSTNKTLKVIIMLINIMQVMDN